MVRQERGGGSRAADAKGSAMADETPLLNEERLRQVFRALAREEVDYAVFGAIALGLHGFPRATGDLDLFIAPEPANVERLKVALGSVFADPEVAEISAEEMCGEFPAVQYNPPRDFGIDILTRLGEAFRWADLDVETKIYDGIPVRVVTPETLWRMKKDTVRPKDRLDAAILAAAFDFERER